MTIREVHSTDGTSLVYRVTGDAAARPLVLLHGWAQSSKCWGDGVLAALSERFRVIAVDLRGHGYSGVPADGYDDRDNWAADVQAVLDAENARGAVLLGWSYGGLVLCDHIAVHGADHLAGVVLVGAITSIGRGEAGGRVGPAMRAAVPTAMSEDPAEAIRALGSFGSALTGPGEGKGVVSQALFGASLCTPPHVRAALFARSASNDDLLRGLGVPVLIVHGTADSVVDVSAARHAEALLPTVTASYWDGVDHGPFVEDPERFVDEVVGFVGSLGAAV
ncbi:MAG: alpha/beta hydrolase [Rhodococcus sp.]|uniref:alpha/beta fold hydrolase n=1 Tax=Rhodococcus TaxID=1827 RepID=UPI0016A25A1A|nr:MULTISPECIES: alpha/beta hydrolase [Rhodococcus]NLV80453.1 alpha/beta hydrolase [Rhodococcus sp. (in: high G+C Gram-positive bacteria)]